MALSYFVERAIEVHCCQENGVKFQMYGEGDEKVTIVSFPMNTTPADGQIR